MTRRIRKNSKEFKAAIANARDIKAYRLSEGFKGSPVDRIPANIVEDLMMTHDGNFYTARLHSNCWYEFTVPEVA